MILEPKLSWLLLHLPPISSNFRIILLLISNSHNFIFVSLNVSKVTELPPSLTRTSTSKEQKVIGELYFNFKQETLNHIRTTGEGLRLDKHTAGIIGLINDI